MLADSEHMTPIETWEGVAQKLEETEAKLAARMQLVDRKRLRAEIVRRLCTGELAEHGYDGLVADWLYYDSARADWAGGDSN